MIKPTTRTKWGNLKSQRRVDSPALLIMAAGGFILFSPCKLFPALFLLFSFFVVAATVDILLQRCAAAPADRTAWRELFQRFQRDVDAAIYRVIGLPPNGRHAYLNNDVRQSFYLRLTENNRRVLCNFRGKSDGEARAYLCRIAVSIALDLVEKERPHVPLDFKDEDDPRRQDKLADPSALDERYLVLRESLDACLEKIARGRKRDRNILIFKLAVYDGLSPEQIAAVPGFDEMSPHAVEQQITRLRPKLRRCLEKK